MPKSIQNKQTRFRNIMNNLCCLATSMLLLNTPCSLVQSASLQITTQADLMQDSHNCNSNVDRLKTGPKDWTKIEGSG